MNKIYFLLTAAFLLACTVSTSASTVAQLPTAENLPVQNATGTPQRVFGVVCEAQSLWLRSCAETTCAADTVLTDGTRVEVVSTRYPDGGGKWYRVNSDAGSGWVNSRYICEVK